MDKRKIREDMDKKEEKGRNWKKRKKWKKIEGIGRKGKKNGVKGEKRGEKRRNGKKIEEHKKSCIEA